MKLETQLLTLLEEYDRWLNTVIQCDVDFQEMKDEYNKLHAKLEVYQSTLTEQPKTGKKQMGSEEQPLYKIEISVGYAFFFWYSGDNDLEFKQGLYEALFKEDTKEVKVYESGALTKHLKISKADTEADKQKGKYY